MTHLFSAGYKAGNFVFNFCEILKVACQDGQKAYGVDKKAGCVPAFWDNATFVINEKDPSKML